ncbi:MAG: heavy-metal-associated domain-containing protein [Crocinitomicaceae bacterium]
MKKFLLYLLVLGFISCKSNSIKNHDIIKNEAASIPIHNATCKISIKGMTCEIGCVRTVKSHLSKMNGVLNVKMDFDTSRTVDFSGVEFDKNMISEDEMKAEIESIANGIYTVTEIVQTEN